MSLLLNVRQRAPSRNRAWVDPPTEPLSRQGSSGSDYGVDIDDDDDNDDDDYGFIWNFLECPGAQMHCFTMNSQLAFKTIDISFVLKVRQGAPSRNRAWVDPPYRASQSKGVERERLWC